ncbi:TetR/AcrR family transcriptional regulator [Agrobacterium sp. rho-8.1]|nr:TetR/AcrR family transcriptional regulator [Agrobacterium sp. rho-8.1]
MRRRQADRRQESMTLILDVAEAEFAWKGFDGTSLTNVAKAAGIDTALMRYYFGDKKNLFEAVFRRRGPFLNELRREAFEAYEAEVGEAMTLEGVIDAFIRPGLQLSITDDGWRNYDAVVGFVNSSGGELRRLMSEVFDDTSQMLLRYMRRVLPDASEEEIYWSYHFLSGSLTFSLSQTGRIDVISNGLVSSRDLGAILDRLPILFGAGIRAMCAQPQNAPKVPQT